MHWHHICGSVLGYSLNSRAALQLSAVWSDLYLREVSVCHCVITGVFHAAAHAGKKQWTGSLSGGYSLQESGEEGELELCCFDTILLEEKMKYPSETMLKLIYSIDNWFEVLSNFLALVVKRREWDINPLKPLNG